MAAVELAGERRRGGCRAPWRASTWPVSSELARVDVAGVERAGGVDVAGVERAGACRRGWCRTSWRGRRGAVSTWPARVDVAGSSELAEVDVAGGERAGGVDVGGVETGWWWCGRKGRTVTLFGHGRQILLTVTKQCHSPHSPVDLPTGLDSTGLHWTPLDSTGLGLIILL